MTYLVDSPCGDCGLATTPHPVDPDPYEIMFDDPPEMEPWIWSEGFAIAALKDDSWEWYMVNDDLWPPGVRWLCVGCLERRLGRRLTPGDFKDVPLNDLMDDLSTPRLRSRLGHMVTPITAGQTGG